MSQPPAVLCVTLPGCHSWERPRPRKGRGAVPSYSEDYRRYRSAWVTVVAYAVLACEWAPPAGSRYGVTIAAAAKGRRDLDRVVSSVCDALQGGNAFSDDCYVDRLAAERCRPPSSGPETRVTVEVLSTATVMNGSERSEHGHE